MAVWMKSALMVAVLLVPGAFVVFLAWVAAKALHMRWIEEQARSAGKSVSVKHVLASIQFRDLLREARAAF